MVLEQVNKYGNNDVQCTVYVASTVHGAAVHADADLQMLKEALSCILAQSLLGLL